MKTNTTLSKLKSLTDAGDNSVDFAESQTASGLIPRVPASVARPSAAAATQKPGVLPPGFSISNNLAGGVQENISMILDNTGTAMNPVAQFDIVNTGVGNAQQIMRIGAVVALAGAYVRYNLAAGSADDAVITDQFGAGCRKVQGFSEIASHIPVIIDQIHISSSDLTQLNRAFTHNIIYMTDAVVDQRTSNIAFTQQKTDQKTTLNVAKGKWILSANQYFSYTIGAAISVTLLLHVAAVGNTAGFIPLNG